MGWKSFLFVKEISRQDCMMWLLEVAVPGLHTEGLAFAARGGRGMKWWQATLKPSPVLGLSSSRTSPVQEAKQCPFSSVLCLVKYGLETANCVSIILHFLQHRLI